MEVRIRLQHGVVYDLMLKIPHEELKGCHLSFPYWEKLCDSSYGYIRHRIGENIPPKDVGLPASHDPEEGWRKYGGALKKYKPVPEKHLQELGLLNDIGNPKKRLVLIGNRNLGNNPGFVAWHKAKQPHCFHLKGDPVREEPHSCLTCYEDGTLRIERLNFKPEADDFTPYSTSDDRKLTDEIRWCTFGQQVLHGGKLVPIEQIIDQFYDIRHVFWFPLHPVRGNPCPDSEEELQKLYEHYSKEQKLEKSGRKALNTFKDRLLEELEAGRPRSRYLHNAVGIGDDTIIILQRHGTVEEIGQWLREEGAEDGLILDNGGSVFTWAWWAFKEVIAVGKEKTVRTGNVIFSAPDWRPETISLLAFVLKGPPRHVEPSGTIAMAMV